MSKYKMDAQQVRARVESIGRNFSSRGVNKVLEAEILTLIEEATGEKLEEPFDESKVRHGSLWRTGEEEFLFLKHMAYPNNFSAVFLPCFRAASSAPFAPNTPKEDVIQVMLRDPRKYRYLGQYDFTAGLPK
jgi:hypothetical protein